MPPRTRSARGPGLKPPSPAAAISPGGLLASAFAGPSWGRWRAVLKAAFAEPLTPSEAALFREVADRDPPPRRVRELWAVAGRRAGKDSIASAIAAIAALADYRPHLRPGERASVLCLASDRNQAKIIFRYISGYFATIPLLKPLVERETDDGLELRNNVEIFVSTNSYRAVRGRTIACAIFDEVAFWRDENSATPDVETYNAVLPGMATIPGAMLIGISSPYRRTGLLFEKFQRSYGRADPDVLVVRGASRLFNPTLSQQVIDDAMARDPEAAGSEYLAQWRSDLSDFLPRDLLDAAVDAGVLTRPPLPGIDYAAFTDPSGGRGDAFALAIAHAEADAVVLDALREWRAPFDPQRVVAEVATLAREYRVATITGDRYAANWVADAFAAQGLQYLQSQRDRSEIYLDALPLFASARARLLDYPKLLHQFAALERRATARGRDIVTHPTGGSDDLANAAAGALTLAATESRPTLVRASALLGDQVAPVPGWAQCVFATMIVGVDGTAASACFAYHDLPNVTDPAQVTLVDVALAPLAPDTIAALAGRLEDLHRVIPRVRAHFAYLPAPFLQHAHLAGLDADPIPAALLADPAALALSAAGHVAAGRFRIAAPAAEKARRLPLAGAFTFHAGERIDAAPLRMAVLVAIELALTPGTARRAA